MTFWFPRRLQELLQAPLFPEKFLFWEDTTGSIGLPGPAQRLHIEDCFEIHILHNQITKIFCTRYGSANASSAQSPCNFCPLADLAISVFREVSTNTNPHAS